MSASAQDSESQVESNYEVYVTRHRARLEATHSGSYVLLHDGEVVGIYDTARDAYEAGCGQHGLGDFSMQEIGAWPVGLGIMTLCLG